ncbi:MAG TPA: hypothetical protein VMX18_03770 [Candidatus Bipolaricaulota bacterium]|nr:hypothetical protein [Candidatus Bipolaricaulota bacterium]
MNSERLAAIKMFLEQARDRNTAMQARHPEWKTLLKANLPELPAAEPANSEPMPAAA